MPIPTDVRVGLPVPSRHHKGKVRSRSAQTGSSTPLSPRSRPSVPCWTSQRSSRWVVASVRATRGAVGGGSGATISVPRRPSRSRSRRARACRARRATGAMRKPTPIRQVDAVTTSQASTNGASNAVPSPPTSCAREPSAAETTRPTGAQRLLPGPSDVVPPCIATRSPSPKRPDSTPHRTPYRTPPAPPHREEPVSSAESGNRSVPGAGKRKGKEVTCHSLPLSTYSAVGGLPQDPGHPAESSADATTCGNGGHDVRVWDGEAWGRDD